MENKKIDIKTIKRVLAYMIKNYKKELLISVIAIILNTIANVAASLFLQTLIDDYITPLIGAKNPIYTELFKAIAIMSIIYLTGVITIFVSSRAMVTVSEGVLKIIRDEMFKKMQKLPIRYFDTHTHGDIMSRYTNDTDALSQMISQSLPQFFSSSITIITTFFAMLTSNIYLTGVVILSLFLMLNVTKGIAKNSAKYFMQRQKSVGEVNGYIEEMINGQKVVKVFCHEEKAKEGFDRLNDELFDYTYKANKYANVLMPVLVALGNIQYVVVAIAGGIFALNGVGNISIGLIVAFLQLSKTFTRPIGQISGQLNSVAMALAGADRIFELMDTVPEKDDGYVTLVNAKYVDGKLTETDEKTGTWAWKHPHHDGRLEYVELKGHIELLDVDFGYEEGKPVLKDISIYAKPGQKIAFVGATGAGKTTITNLLNRFYDIEDR